MHYRRVIREALQAQIIAAATIAGANVFTGRARPILEILRKRESVVSIYTGDESAVRSTDGQIYERSLTVSVELAAGGGDDLDDVLDAFALQIENAINANPTLGNVLSSDLALESTVSEITAAGNQLIGAVRLDYAATYHTAAAEADLFPAFPVPDGFDPAAVRPIARGDVDEYPDDSWPLAGPHAPHAPLPGVGLAPDGWTPSPALTDLDGIVPTLPDEPAPDPDPEPEPEPEPLALVVNDLAVNIDGEQP